MRINKIIFTFILFKYIYMMLENHIQEEHEESESPKPDLNILNFYSKSSLNSPMVSKFYLIQTLYDFIGEQVIPIHYQITKKQKHQIKEKNKLNPIIENSNKEAEELLACKELQQDCNDSANKLIDNQKQQQNYTKQIQFNLFKALLENHIVNYGGTDQNAPNEKKQQENLQNQQNKEIQKVQQSQVNNTQLQILYDQIKESDVILNNQKEKRFDNTPNTEMESPIQKTKESNNEQSPIKELFRQQNDPNLLNIEPAQNLNVIGVQQPKPIQKKYKKKNFVKTFMKKSPQSQNLKVAVQENGVQKQAPRSISQFNAESPQKPIQSPKIVKVTFKKLFMKSSK